MENVVFEFQGITLIKSGQIIFEHISFSLKKGEHWAFVGASGSGKSLMLDMIAGKTTADKGQITFPFFTEYLNDHSDNDPLFNWQRFVAHVLSRQHFSVFSKTNDLYFQQRFNSSDSENIETVASYLSSINIYSPSGIWSFEKVTNRLRLLPLLDKQLIKLSNGETKRLLIAAALIRNPIILLLDNPLTGMDISSRNDFNQLITEIVLSGMSVIITTSPTEIPDAITHVAVFDQGTTLHQLEKSRFHADDFMFSSIKKPDEKELNKLLFINDPDIYQTIIGMEEVSIHYVDKTILENINWQVKQGERWALLGHNGAGKSTLLSLVNGDNPQAYANKITLFDRRRGTGESIWDIKKKIGFVSHELVQYFPLESSCLQVIESGFYDTIGLFRPSNPDNVDVVMRWMRLFEIENFGDKLFKNASANTQLLCLLARALVKNPPLLIFDEPCQGLDIQQQELFKFLVNKICSNIHITLVYVSHYQQEIPEAVTRILELENGKVISNE